MFFRYSCVLLMLLLGCTPQSGEQQSKNTGDALGGTTAQKERVEEEIGEPEPEVLLPVAPLPVVEVVSDPWGPTVPFFGGGGGGGNSKLNCSNGLAEGDACSDGDICTYSDRCVAGKCVGNDIPECCTEKTVATACDDNDPCTDQVCNEFNECTYPPAQGPIPCDDNNQCTANDTCSNGTCAGISSIVCFSDSCNTAACNPATGFCELTPRQNGTDCTPSFPDSCVTSYECDCGECVATALPDGTDCSTTCDLRAFCVSGSCTAQQPAPQPYCIDADTSLCTSTQCFNVFGSPQCSDLSTFCIESDPCQESIGCNPENGQCEYTTKDCNDHDPCTLDSCVTDNNTGCVNTPTAGCKSCMLPGDCFPPDQPLPTCSDNWQANCINGKCFYGAGNNNCEQPSNKCEKASCTLDGCIIEPKIICGDNNPNDCKDVTCDPADGQCKAVTDTTICPYPQNVCCEQGDGGVCIPNCLGPFCGCFFRPEVPQP